jgi:predicted dehydrogenase
MALSGKINVAVVGLGWVATNRHIPVILRHPHLHLYGVIDKHPERIKRLKEKFPWIQTSVSPEGAMPWNADVQAVVVATDPLNHYALTKKLLLSGKHVLSEKPLTMKPEESLELQEMASQMGTSCCVVHNFQFARSTMKMRSMLDKGELGEVQSIEAIQLSNPRRRLPSWYEQLPWGLFYDESPHMFYMLEALCGQEIQHIASTVLRKAGQSTPLSVSGYYRAGGVPIRLNMNFNASLSEWHIAVFGSKVICIADIFRDILVTVPNDELHRAREILTSSASVIGTHLWGFLKSGILLAQGKLFYGNETVWDKFFQQITGRQPAAEISVGRGARVVRLQHEIMSKSSSFEFRSDENPHAQ